jgi:flagellar biosynthesis/type III secretory pathway chaperone
MTTPITLLTHIQQQLQTAQALQVLLQSEYQALLMSDIDELAGLVAQKRSCAEQLERASLALNQATQNRPEQSVMAADDATRFHWQQLIDCAETLRKQNLRNGALLNERQARLRWIAQHAGADTHPLYAPAGLYDNRQAGRSLARA